MYCPSCGKETPGQGIFCPHCGARIKPAPKWFDYLLLGTLIAVGVLLGAIVVHQISLRYVELPSAFPLGFSCLITFLVLLQYTASILFNQQKDQTGRAGPSKLANRILLFILVALYVVPGAILVNLPSISTAISSARMETKIVTKIEDQFSKIDEAIASRCANPAQVKEIVDAAKAEILDSAWFKLA